RIAAAMLCQRAMPWPAISKAVPWSTLVRKKGRPRVTLTPSSKPASLTGTCPWSWYMATTKSNSPWDARQNTVSAGQGPLASMPSPRAARTAGAISRISSSPKRPPSPACGFRPATPAHGRHGGLAARRRQLPRLDPAGVAGPLDPLRRRQAEIAGEPRQLVRVARHHEVGQRAHFWLGQRFHGHLGSHAGGVTGR